MIGREAEVARVARFLDRVPSDPAALLIEGEAGIGKTTVWLEAVASAEASGYRVLQARPAEAEATLSYAALADLIGTTYDETRTELPPPQQRALDVALLQTETDEPADPRTTATALLTVLATAAQDWPVLVAIDDVQWLDRASERALGFAARRLPANVGLLLARRSTDEGGAAPIGIGELIETVALGPLSVAALHHLIRERLGLALRRPALLRIAETSGGNPFYALELARALGEATRPDQPHTLPGNLLTLVQDRIEALPAEARNAALVVSALAAPNRDLIRRVLGEQATTGLEQAQTGGVIEEHAGRLRFTHPLLASAVYGSAPAERRRQLHHRLADIVTDPEQRAHHLAQAITEPDEATAAQIAEAAAASAMRGAQDAAAELYGASVRLTPPDHPEQLASRLLGEGSAVFHAGDVARARVLAEESIATSQSGSSHVSGLLLLASVAWIDRSSEGATEFLEQALAAAGDDPVLRARIHATLASYSTPTPARCVLHADAAIELLDGGQHDLLLGNVLLLKFFAEASLAPPPDRALLERGLALEEQAGVGPAKSPIPLIWFRFMDEFDAARAQFEADERWCRERGQEGWRANRLGHIADVELRAGNWALAERYAEESCSVIEQLANRGPWSVPLRTRASIDAHRGRFERARATLMPFINETERVEDLWWAAISLSVLGFVELTAGDDRAVDQALTRMAAYWNEVGVRDHGADRSEPDHVEAMVAMGELDRARIVIERLEWRGRALPRLWIAATLPRTRALVLAAEGEVDAALAQLDEAPEVADLPFELARSLLVKGALQRRSKRKREAAATLTRALELFEHLGSPPWSDRARAELARVGLRHADGDELTATERRIAELAASGLTNREVAQAAFVSPKTVEANLARVYRKLGIRSRAELGAHMGSHSAQT